MRIERSVEPPPNWDELHRQDPRATLFLHPRWMQALLRANASYRPLYLLARDGGDLLGFLPMVRTKRFGLDQFLSLPFGSHGGPLLKAGAGPDVVAALGQGFRDLGTGRGVLRFELTIFDPPPEWRQSLSGSLGEFAQELDTHVIDLNELYGRYRRSAERTLRASTTSGVSVAIENGPAAYDALARMHALQARHWPGIEPYSRDTIDAVAQTFGEDARLYVARQDGQAVAACLCLEHAGREIHPWVSGAAPSSRESGAFHRVMDTAIREAKERGLAIWHFGGSGGDSGIAFFKESFGARRVPVLRCFHIAGWARKLRKRPAWDA
jgi:CelD/BcsL family acetyltransferase involved in cellulose biosynthesis